jgi:hypothetical protein
MFFINRYLWHLLFAMLCILITACATPQNARDKGPVASYKSTKPAKAVSVCVATAWESGYGLTNPVNVRPTEDGYTLQISANANTMVVLDIADVKGGSESKYYKGIVWLEGKWDKAVESCQ